MKYYLLYMLILYTSITLNMNREDIIETRLRDPKEALRQLTVVYNLILENKNPKVVASALSIFRQEFANTQDARIAAMIQGIEAHLAALKKLACCF